MNFPIISTRAIRKLNENSVVKLRSQESKIIQNYDQDEKGSSVTVRTIYTAVRYD